MDDKVKEINEELKKLVGKRLKHLQIDKLQSGSKVTMFTVEGESYIEHISGDFNDVILRLLVDVKGEFIGDILSGTDFLYLLSSKPKIKDIFVGKDRDGKLYINVFI